MESDDNPEAPESAELKRTGERTGCTGKWHFNRFLEAPELQEHRAWKRSKLSLLTIGVAVVLVVSQLNSLA